jgi:exodeoxyribonuclease VII small subunit
LKERAVEKKSPETKKRRAQGAENEEPTFEASLGRLGEIVEQLESGELPLERSLELFEEGVRLSRASQAKLDSAERRVEELLGVDEDGEPEVRELPSD